MHGLNFVSIPKGRMECVKNLYTRCERSITICKRSKRNASGLNYTQAVWTSCNFMQPVKTSCKRSKLHASSTKLCASGPNSCLVPNPIQKLELGSTAEKDQQIMASAILAGLLCWDSAHCLFLPSEQRPL